jgi:hypothetical protein
MYIGMYREDYKERSSEEVFRGGPQRRSSKEVFRGGLYSLKTS